MQIITKRGEVKILAEIFKTSVPTVISALHYRYNSDLCKRIRACALERGGAICNN